MTAALGALVVIALVDSTSIGTLVVPIWLMLDERRKWINVVLYLGTISVFYFAVGLVLLLGAHLVLDDWASSILASPLGGVLLVVAAVVLIILGVRADPRRRPAADRSSVAAGIERRPPSVRSTVALALTAGAVEVATMLPYLAALGIISSLDSPVVRVVVLAAYVSIMVVPAAVLLVARQLFWTRSAEMLRRLRGWLVKHSADALSILLVVAGVYLGVNGVATLTGAT